MTVTLVASGNGGYAIGTGFDILRRGGSALDAVETCAREVEADTRDVTVGRGGLPNIAGQVELDASIIDGTTRRVGAVGALTGYLHPISVARAVMDRLPHVLLVGDGAGRFAAEIGAERARLLTASSRAAWRSVLTQAGASRSRLEAGRPLAPLVRAAMRRGPGTVNFLAQDRRGRMASAVSTSGWAFKYPGRLGDSPINGAGNYCDSRFGAAACTGFGEIAMRCLSARTAVDHLAEGRGAAAAGGAAVAEALAVMRQRQWISMVVLAADGSFASVATPVPRRFAEFAGCVVQRTGMDRPRPVKARIVRRSSAP